MRATYIFALSASPFMVHAQDDSLFNAPFSGCGFEVNGIAGKVFKHEEKFRLPIPDLSTGIDIVFIKKTYGKREWEQHRNYPTIGVGLNYINYGIDSIYGRNFALYPCLELPIIRTNHFDWTVRIGDGIAYVTKAYQRQTPVDTINTAISNHFNDFVILHTDFRYHINEHWDIQAGANATHISNASYRKPNLGVNMAGAHLGVRYFPVTSKPQRICSHLQPLKNRWLMQFRMGMAIVSAQAPLGPKYPIYIATAYASKRWSGGKNKAFGGIDYSYHNDINAFLHDNNLETGKEAQNSYKSALFVGNEFLMGHVGIVLQMGAYIKQAYIRKDAVYEKVGGNIYLIQKETGPIKECFVSVFLKTHTTNAEFGELGFGIGF